VYTVRSRKRLAKEEFQRVWGERYGDGDQ